MIGELPERLRAAQRTFERTGGLHATGLFTPDGRADARARGRRPPQRARQGHRQPPAGGRRRRSPARVALVSGRASFELVQKAAVAGIPVLCAVGAPSSLAVDAARRLGLTLAGFVRDGRFNVYSGAARIALASS